MENRQLTQSVDKPRYVDKRIVPARFWPAVLLIGSFIALLYAVVALDRILPADLRRHGIAPRSLSGLDGILWKPLLNIGWEYLAVATPPLVVLGFLVTAGGIRQWAAVTATIWLVSGLGVWLTAEPNSITNGVMGVATGWLVFLVTRGIVTRGFLQLGVACAVLLYWGGILAYLVPSQRWFYIDGGWHRGSWQGHLFGAIGGLLAMWLVARQNRVNKIASLPLSSREE